MIPREGTWDVTPTMWAALGAMPVVLRRTSRGWVKPVGAPSKPTLDALQARGLVERRTMDGVPRWMRTPQGDAAVAR